MPHPITKYRCSLCGKEFDTYMEACVHEVICNKCGRCQHAYYVYGCEFNCDLLAECKPPEYKLFEEKIQQS